MKSSIKNLLAKSLTALVLSTALFTTTVAAADKIEKTASMPIHFNRISVSGNVEIILVQRSKEGISYANDDAGSVNVTQEGNLLCINSTDRNYTKLIVYIDDIFRIEASDHAIVKTEGKITIKFLQVFLKGNAHADLYTSTEGLYTVIKDNADLKLSGSTDSHTLVMGKTPKLTMDRFAALKTNISAIETNAVDKEIAGLK